MTTFDIYADTKAPRAKRHAAKKPAAKKAIGVGTDSYLDGLDSKTKRLVMALERLYGKRPYP